MPKTRLTLPVEGMECGVCASAVRNRIARVDGVDTVSVNHANGLASVILNKPDAASVVVQSLREGGFDCRRSNLSLSVPGLRRRTDMDHIVSVVAAIPGVLSVSPNVVSETLELTYLSGSATIKSYEFTLNALGFAEVEVVTAGVLDEKVQAADAGKRLIWLMVTALVAWLLTLVAALPVASDQGNTFFGWVAGLLIEPVRSSIPSLFELGPVVLSAILAVVTLAAILLVGRHDLDQAWKSFQLRAADQHTLLGLGLVVAWLYATVATFLLPGTAEMLFPAINGVLAFAMLTRWISNRGLARLNDDLLSVVNLLPPKTHIEKDGQEQDVVLQDVSEGERVVVKPGETVPVDGNVISGESDVDESNLTGDELPVTKSRGSQVYAGSVNGRGTFAVEVTATGSRTGLARMIAAISHADLSGVAVADRGASIVARLVPVSIALALLTFGVWFALGSTGALTLAVSGLLSVLIVTIPQPFANSAPLAYISALNFGLKNGIVVPAASTLDRLGRVDTVVFDKSGTLTKGDIMVSHVLGAERSDGATVSPTEILRLAAAVESQSEHPVGHAVVASAHSRNIAIAGVERFVEMSGRGVRGVVGRFLVEVISVTHARERNHDLGSLTSKVEKHVLQGRMPVVVVVNDTVQGLIVFSDEIRPTAKPTVKKLTDLGVSVVMLSGDSKAGAGLAAKEIGIDRVLAEVAPAGKAEEIARLQWDGRDVAAVGDGFEDAEALAEASVGMAFGMGGRLQEAGSDVGLVSENLQLVPTTIELARHTTEAAEANLRLLLGYHFLGIPLAAGVLYPLTGFVMGPAVAAFLAMTWSSLITSRSLAVRQFRPSEKKE